MISNLKSVSSEYEFAEFAFLILDFDSDRPPHGRVPVVVDEDGDEREQGGSVEEDVEHAEGVRVLKIFKKIKFFFNYKFLFFDF